MSQDPDIDQLHGILEFTGDQLVGLDGSANPYSVRRLGAYAGIVPHADGLEPVRHPLAFQPRLRLADAPSPALAALSHRLWERITMDATSAIKRATRGIVSALSPDTVEGTDILETLKKEHEEVKSLFKELEDCDSAPKRKALVKRIKVALVPHTKAEEKVVYDAVIALRDKDAKIDGYEGYLEHDLAARTLKTLVGIADARSPEHRATAKVLKELVEHHIKEEEDRVWSDVKDNFSDEDRAEMNASYIRAKARVKVPS